VASINKINGLAANSSISKSSSVKCP
jgi:hypothetical protein